MVLPSQAENAKSRATTVLCRNWDRRTRLEQHVALELAGERGQLPEGRLEVADECTLRCKGIGARDG